MPKTGQTQRQQLLDAQSPLFSPKNRQLQYSSPLIISDSPLIRSTPTQQRQKEIEEEEKQYEETRFALIIELTSKPNKLALFLKSIAKLAADEVGITISSYADTIISPQQSNAGREKQDDSGYNIDEIVEFYKDHPDKLHDFLNLPEIIEAAQKQGITISNNCCQCVML